MAIKGLMEVLPKQISGLEEPCPIFLLTKATKIPSFPIIDVSIFSPGFMLQIDFMIFNVEIIYGFTSTFVAICSATSHPFYFPSRSKRPPIDILKLLVTKFSNQYNKVAFVRFGEYGALEKYSEFMRKCHNMNIIVENKVGDALSLNGESENSNKTLDNITRGLIMNSSHNK